MVNCRLFCHLLKKIEVLWYGTVMTSNLRDRYKLVWNTKDNANVTSTLNANDKNRIVASNKYRFITVWLMVNLIELT